MVVEKDGLQTLDLYCAHKISKTSYSSPIMGIWPISNRSLLLLVTKENELQLFRTSGGFDLLATLPIHTSSTFLDKDLLVYFNALEERIEVLSSERRALIEIDNHLFLGLFDPSTSSSSSVHLAKKIKVEKNDKLGASRETWSHFILHLSLPSTTPQMEKKRQHLQISCDSTNANLITISYVWNSNLPLPTSLQTYCIAGAATKVTLKSAMYSAESRSVNLLFLKEQERNDSAHTHKNEGYLYLVSNSLSCLDDTTLLQTGSARRKQLCASFDQLVSAHKGLLVNIESLEAKVAHPFLSLLNRIFEENVSGHATTLLTWKSLLCTSDLPSAQALQMLKPSAGQLQKFSQALSTVHLCKIKEDLERVSECLDSLLSIHALADIWHDHHTHELVQFRRSFLLQKTHLLSSLSALASFLFFLVANLEAAAAFEAAISAADQKSLILQWTASSIKSLDSWLVALTESQFSKVVTESHEQLSNHIIPSLLTVRTDDLSTPGSALEFDNHARLIPGAVYYTFTPSHFVTGEKSSSILHFVPPFANERTAEYICISLEGVKDIAQIEFYSTFLYILADMNGARHFLQIQHPVALSTINAHPQIIHPHSLHVFLNDAEEDDHFLPDTFNVNGSKGMVCFLDRAGKECRIYDLLDLDVEVEDE